MAPDGVVASAKLARLAKQVEHWRSTRSRSGPMPDRLWRRAVALAREIGLHPVKAALRLNFDSLRQRVAAVETRSEVAPRFVELSGAAVLPAVGAVVEVTDSEGARLTVRLAPESMVDVAQLVQAFRTRRT